jgi:apolipoprotein N-acyltransferase
VWPSSDKKAMTCTCGCVGLATLTVCLWCAAFHFSNTPFFCAAVAPLFGLGRLSCVRSSWWVAYAFSIGFIVCWLSAPYLSAFQPSSGLAFRSACCGVFGVQVVGAVYGIRATRHLPALKAAPFAAFIAATCEILRVYLFDWPTLLLASPAASTPVSQFARFVGMFGVSTFLYLVNFLVWPDLAHRGAKRWTPPCVAFTMATLTWVGGSAVAARTPVPALSFAALIVQPNAKGNSLLLDSSVTSDRISTLNTLTCDALRSGRYDLIIWPESVIFTSEERLNKPDLLDRDMRNLNECFYRYLRHYNCACLVGVPVMTRDGSLRNSACLVTPDGQLARHDKSKLMLIAEATPQWIERLGLGRWVRSWFGVATNYVAGSDSKPLTFATSHGTAVSVNVGICYEKHFPWLAQYADVRSIDAIIHISDESQYAEFPSLGRDSVWNVQYRAIETRKWQLVCDKWANSAIIDPKGTVRMILAAAPGIISTDEVVKSSR